MLRLPVSVPTVPGEKVTLIVQLAPAATELPQVLVWLKGIWTEILLIASGRLPVLVNWISSGLLVVPTL